MSAPAGRFVYKILATASRAGVITSPPTFPLPATEADAKDGFVHLSTAHQVPGVLDRFYSTESDVTLLKFDRKKLEPFKPLRWEGPADSQSFAHGHNVFPHLYGADLEQSELDRDGVRQLSRDPGESWTASLENLAGWLET